MSRHDRDRLDDISAAITAITSHVSRGPLADELGMRDHLAHRYFMTEVQVIQDTVDHDLEPLLAAVERMRNRLPR